MILTALTNKLGDYLSLWLIPHHRNNHHPHATRHTGLIIFLIGILVSQLLTNVATGKQPLTLGFATNVQKEELITLTNQERASKGAPLVVESPELSQAALLKAQDMFAKDYWAHVGPDGTTPWHFFELAGYKYVYAGENLARGFDTSSGVVAGWMNSLSHRENLLNPNYQHIGMAVVNGQMVGESTTLVVQLFGANSAGGTQVISDSPKVESTVTMTPTPLPRPTIVAVGSSAASQVIPVRPTGQYTAPTRYQFQVLTSFRPLGTLNANQQVLLLSLVILAAIFLVDSLVLIRKKLFHTRPHVILHGLVVLTLIGFILLSGKGLIL